MNRRRAIAQIGGAVGSVVIGAGCGGGRFARKSTRQAGSTISITVNNTRPLSGSDLEITIRTNGNLEKSLLVNLTSDSEVLQVPTQVFIPVGGISTTITRPVGAVDSKKAVTITATTTNDTASVTIYVMDGTKARSYERFPQSANTIRVDWHPGLVEAGSYNIKKMTPGATVLSQGTLASMNFGGERSYTRVSENATRYQMESGRKLDLRLEARYLGVNGAVSKSTSESRSYDEAAYSFSVEHRIDKGLYAIEMPQDKYETLRAEYFKNSTLFENTYGTHYVSSVNLECYVRATYYLTKVSSTLARTSGLEVSAKGGWKASSISVGRSMKDRLSMLSSGHSVSVAIETNVSNASLDKTITSPSDVDGVLSDVAKLQQDCATAKPVVSAYNLSPWADLFLFEVSEDYLMGDQAVEITEDLYERQRLLDQLDEVANNSVKYSYLGTKMIDYYKNSRQKVRDEITVLKNHLKALAAAPINTSVSYQRADLDVETEFLVPQVEFIPFYTGRLIDETRYYRNENNSSIFDGRPSVQEINFYFTIRGCVGPYTVRFRNGQSGRVETCEDGAWNEVVFIQNGIIPSKNVVKRHWMRRYTGVNAPIYNEIGSYNFVGTGWFLDFVDNQNRVFMTIPAPVR